MDLGDGAVMAGLAAGVNVVARSLEKLVDRNSEMTAEAIKKRFADIEKDVDAAAKLIQETTGTLPLVSSKLNALELRASGLAERVDKHHERFWSLEKELLASIHGVGTNVTAIAGQLTALMKVVNSLLRGDAERTDPNLRSPEDGER